MQCFVACKRSSEVGASWLRLAGMAMSNAMRRPATIALMLRRTYRMLEARIVRNITKVPAGIVTQRCGFVRARSEMLFEKIDRLRRVAEQRVHEGAVVGEVAHWIDRRVASRTLGDAPRAVGECRLTLARSRKHRSDEHLFRQTLTRTYLRINEGDRRIRESPRLGDVG